MITKCPDTVRHDKKLEGKIAKCHIMYNVNRLYFHYAKCFFILG